MSALRHVSSRSRLSSPITVAGPPAEFQPSISPDGTRLLVSASTARKVHVINTADGRIVGEFESGDQPHENNYSADGDTIFHASIGTVYTPTDDPAMDDTKGDRWFQVVDNKTFKIKKRIDMGQKLEEAGYPDMSSAVRPMALSPDERKVYFQVSFFHGFVEYNFKQDRVTRVANMPIAPEIQDLPREEYLLDSAHHGLAMNPRGTKLCAAGTMSDYGAIVVRKTFPPRSFMRAWSPFGRWPFGLALATVLPSVAMAQEGRLFKNAWFWGAKGGFTSFSTDRVKNAVAPSLGVEWLITRSRGGLYASYDQAFFDEETVVFTQAYGPHTVRMENMRRVTLAGLAFPFNIGTLRPYGGVGLAMNFIQNVTPVDPFTSTDQETLVARRAMDTKDRAAFIAAASGERTILAK